MSQVSLGRPEFVPGTPPGHPTAKFLDVIFLYRFFLSIIKGFGSRKDLRRSLTAATADLRAQETARISQRQSITQKGVHTRFR